MVNIWYEDIKIIRQMNKRCLVNVATGDLYCKMQERLARSFSRSIDKLIHYCANDHYCKELDLTKNDITKKGIDLIIWDNISPSGSRSHEESPYGFKIHAIKAAYEMGYTSILWLDSPAYAVKEDISPIFDKIEKEGYYAMSHIDPLERFVGSNLLKFYNLKRSDLFGLNLPSGSCYGFDLNSRIGYPIFYNMELAEINGLFDNEMGEDFVHRHDEAVLAVYLKLKDKPVFTFDPLFQSDSPECVIKSGG